MVEKCREIQRLHQSIWRISHFKFCFVYLNWCRISSINRGEVWDHSHTHTQKHIRCFILSATACQKYQKWDSLDKDRVGTVDDCGYPRIHTFKVLGWMVLDFLVVGWYMPIITGCTRLCMNVVSIYRSISGRSSGNLPVSCMVEMIWVDPILDPNRWWRIRIYIDSAFRFCFSCCMLKYELWMIHLFHVDNCPRPLSKKNMHWCEVFSP